VDGGGNFLNAEPYPRPDARDRVKFTRETPIEDVLRGLDEAVRAKDQPLASAIVQHCADTGRSERAIFDALLVHAVSDDGALHGEKYYRTAMEEFASTRPAFRWRHLVGLGRVTASASGQPAPGYADACRLLNV
jgi:hypothetical protein